MQSEWHNFLAEHSSSAMNNKKLPNREVLIQQPLLMSLDQWGVIAVQGKDAAKFLQGQLTINVQTLEENYAKLGGYCNLQGRLHSLFYLIKARDQHYWIVLPRSILSHTLAILQKYALFSKVKITDQSEQKAILGITKLSKLPFFSDQALKENFSVYFDTDSHAIYLRIHPDRAFVILDTKIAIKYWQNFATTAAIAPDIVWDWFDIQAGIPQLSNATTEFFLPHYVNLPQLGGVDFEKGCYLGQEIIARMQYRGNIKKHLYCAKIATQQTVAPGQEIVNETAQVVGNIVHAAPEEDHIICLISAQDEAVTKPLFLSTTTDLFYEIEMIKV